MSQFRHDIETALHTFWQQPLPTALAAITAPRRRTAAATTARREDVRCRQPSRPGGAGARREPAGSVHVARTLACRRSGRPAHSRPRWATGEAQRQTTARGGSRAAQGCAGARIPHRSVDAAAGRRDHRANQRCHVPPGPRVAALAAHGLEPPEADATGGGARRRTSHSLGQAPLAGAKRGPDNGMPGSTSRTRAASR